MGIIFPMKRSFPLLVTLLFLTLSLFPWMAVYAQPFHFSDHPASQNLVEAVNALRESNGLDPYVEDPTLTKIAQAHADYIAGIGVLTHFDVNGDRPYQRALNAGYAVAGNLSAGGYFAEAIYSGRDISFDDVVAAWQENPSDANAMLFPDYQDIGVGVSAADGVTYFVLNVGSEELPTTNTPPTASTPMSAVSPLASGTGTALVILNTPEANGDVYHIVQKDEALWSIALAYGTTIDELKRLNSLASDEIFEGQRLLILRAATATPTSTPAPVTATLGIPTSTATRPIPPSPTFTATPLPVAPVSLQNSGKIVGGIVSAALLAAGFGAFLGRKRLKASEEE